MSLVSIPAAGASFKAVPVNGKHWTQPPQYGFNPWGRANTFAMASAAAAAGKAAQPGPTRSATPFTTVGIVQQQGRRL